MQWFPASFTSRLKANRYNMPPKKRARGNSWVDDETECLLSIWEELHVQAQLDSPTKADSTVYNRISKEMKEKGFEKSAVQCKERMKYLRKRLISSMQNSRRFLKKSTSLNSKTLKYPTSLARLSLQLASL